MAMTPISTKRAAFRCNIQFMIMDLADLQYQAVARGFVHDFGINHESRPDVVAATLRIVDSISMDSGTDPGDDVTMYLIESPGENGYLIVSDSFHTDPAKAAFLDELLIRDDK
jgi:hypothetical protein